MWLYAAPKEIGQAAKNRKQRREEGRKREKEDKFCSCQRVLLQNKYHDLENEMDSFTQC